MTRPLSALPLLAALALLAPLPAGAAAKPVGVEACGRCHPEAVAVWKAGPHARAEQGLGTRGEERACLVCHGPLREAKQAGVGCEACHGSGEHYAKRYVMRDRELARAVGLVMPGEKECRACHDATSPSLIPFDYATKLKLVQAHGRADREARKAAKIPAAAAPPAAPGGTRPAKGTAR